MDLYGDDDGDLQQHEFQGNTMMTHTSMSLTGLSMSSFASDYSANSSAKNEGECGHEEERGRLELSTSLWSNEGNEGDRCENDEAVDLRSPRTIDEEKGDHDDEGQIGHDEERQEDGDNTEGDGDAQMESELKRDVENEETTGITQRDTQRDMQVPDSEDGSISPDETNGHQSAAPEAIVTPATNLPDYDQRVQDFGENDSDNSEAPVHPVETSSLFDKDGDIIETQQGTQQTEITSAPIALPCLPIPSPPAPISDDTFSLESVVTAKQGKVRCTVSDHEEEAKSPAPPVPHAIPSPLHYTLCDLFPVVFEEKQTPFSRKKAPPQVPNKRPSAATSTTKSPPPASTSKARNTKSGSSRIAQQGQQRDQSVHDQLDRTQKQLKAATQTIKMHQVVDAEKKQLAQRNARLRQQLDALIADLQRTKAENAKLVAENELYAAKLPHLQAELLQESCHADETQAQVVQMQLSLTQLKARVHVLQTRNSNIETQLEKQHMELRTCKQELRRKAAAVHTTTEKLTKAETEMNHMKNRHAQDMLQWKTKLATMQQKWDADTAKRDREANLKMVDALRDAKAHAGTTMKKNAALEARVLQLEDELKHSKRDADARQRDLIAQMNQVRTLERLLRKCHRTEATLRNDVALLRANAKSASMEERGVYSNEMRRDRDVSQKSRRSNLRQDASLFPLDLLLLPTDSDSGEHLCACDSRSLGRPMRKDVACATEPSRCLKCEDAAEQVRAAQSEIQRLRLLHSKELNVQVMAFTRALSSRSQSSSDNVNGRGISRLSSTSSA